jgi:hypothetical protein
MQGETLRRAFDSPIQPSAPSYGISCTRWGCVAYEVNDDTIEVVVPDAPAERQGRWELHLLSGDLASTISRVSSWSFSTDPGGSAWVSARPHALLASPHLPVRAQPGLAWGVAARLVAEEPKRAT